MLEKILDRFFFFVQGEGDIWSWGIFNIIFPDEKFLRLLKHHGKIEYKKN